MVHGNVLARKEIRPPAAVAVAGAVLERWVGDHCLTKCQRASLLSLLLA